MDNVRSHSADADLDAALDAADLAELRRRRSEKWRGYAGDVLPMWIAEMDYPLADPIKRALHDAVDRSDTGYAPAGAEALAHAFAGFTERRFGWTVDPRGVSVVGDVVVGIEEILEVLTKPGDGVVMHTPSYPPFFEMLEKLGRRLVAAPLHHGDHGWDIDLDAFETALAARPSAYLLINPHNPTGRVFTRAELAAVAELAERYDVPIIADEIHAPLVLPGATHVPLTTLGGWAAESSVVFTSASKTFDIAGLKCALAIADGAGMREALRRLPSTTPHQASLFGVIAAEAAFTEGDAWLDAVIRRLDANRTLLGRLLSRHLPSIGWTPHEASYLAWLDCRELGLGDEPAAAFADLGNVGLSRGLDFGEAGRGWVRLNLGTSSAILEEAVHRMTTAVRSEHSAPETSRTHPATETS